MSLPKWVTNGVLSVTEEAADYVSLTPSERAELVDVLCRDAALMLEAHPDAQGALDHQDPLPASSVTLFARLRAEHREHRGVSGRRSRPSD